MLGNDIRVTPKTPKASVTHTGRGKAVAKAFREIVRRLKIDPFRVGEATFRLSAMRLQVRTTAVRPLVVDFAVSEVQRIVFIKSVKLLSVGGS